MQSNSKVKFYKTQFVSAKTVDKKWLKIDAKNKVVGRIASQIAMLLRGKHMPYYTPHADCGDYVVVTNVAQTFFTGKKETDKSYSSYSGYPSGQKNISLKTMREKHPEELMRKAVKGMLPKNKLGRALLQNLFLYLGSTHSHTNQNLIDC